MIFIVFEVNRHKDIKIINIYRFIVDKLFIYKVYCFLVS